MKAKTVCRVFILIIINTALIVFASPNPQTDSLKFEITFPSHRDTVTTDRIRIAGGTDPDASVWINNESVYVYRHGAFVSRVALNEGLNQILICAQKSGITRMDTLSIFRLPSLKPWPPTPVLIDTMLMEPRKEVWILPGDFLHVTCKGSSGGIAQFRIADICNWIPMSETKFGGVYEGSVRIPVVTMEKTSQVFFKLRGVDSVSVDATAPGKVKILPFEIPTIALCKFNTQLWTAADGGAVLGVLPDSIKLTVGGKIRSRYKVLLSQIQSVYIDESDLEVLTPGEVIRCAASSSPVISVDNDWLCLSMEIDHPVPFFVEQSLQPTLLDITLFGVFQQAPWITFPEFPTEIKNIIFSQPSTDVLKIRIMLNQRQPWGYRVVYNANNLKVYIRRTPRFSKDTNTPLKGLKIVVDPGHGGLESGAISPTGLPEKDVNLAIGKALAHSLQSAGATVMMTRRSDSTMTLQERIDMARKNKPHIFLWIHNNSVGEDADPEVGGTSTYFTLPQNQALAWAVYPRLVNLGLRPFGRIYSSYYVTRTSDMLVLLVESAFMSNPKDEQKLADYQFLRKIAKAICDGVEDFARMTQK